MLFRSRRTIRRLQHLRPAVPKQRTELEPLLPAAHRVHRSLVSQVHVLADSQSHRVLVREDGAARRFRLADDVRRAHVVEEAIVDTAGVPCVDAVGAAERGVADERVATAVVVFGFVVGAVVVLLLRVSILACAGLWGLLRLTFAQ